jgi:hypothetical protein
VRRFSLLMQKCISDLLHQLMVFGIKSTSVELPSLRINLPNSKHAKAIYLAKKMVL